MWARLSVIIACGVAEERFMNEDRNAHRLTLSDHLRFALAPLTLLIAFGAYVALYQLLGLPSVAELIELAKRYYSQYGYWFIFLSAFLEGLLIVGWYLPGSTALMLGVVFARDGALEVHLLLALSITGFSLASAVNYALGYYGWYHLFVRFGLKGALDNIRGRVARRGLSLIFFTYAQPNLAALTATACGILRLRRTRFLLYSILALVIWNTVWTVAFYLSGPALLKLINFWVALPLLALWFVVQIIRSHRRRRRSA